jgi:hypothetical protein
VGAWVGTEPGTQAMVRQRVDELLSGSPGLRALPDDRRQAIVRATARVAQVIVGGEGGPASPGAVGRGSVHSADFPGFVRGLVDGVFRAIVDASVEQMQAYGDLVTAVADQIQATGAGDGPWPGREEVAEAILAGINRIVTTGGRTPLRACRA